MLIQVKIWEKVKVEVKGKQGGRVKIQANLLVRDVTIILRKVRVSNF